MKLKALIFDVDGTLADTEETHRLAFNAAFLEQGLRWDWDRQLYARLLRTTGGKERIAAYVDTLGVDTTERAALVARIPDIHRRKTALYSRMVEAGKAPLREGIEPLLDQARSAGVRLAIATTTTFENIRALIDTNLGTGAVYRFDAIGAGDDVPRKKPAPDVYEFVMRKLGLAADECVAIEDSSNGLRAARGAGLFTIVTPSQWTLDEDLADADLLVPSLGAPGLDIKRIDSLLTADRMNA